MQQGLGEKALKTLLLAFLAITFKGVGRQSDDRNGRCSRGCCEGMLDGMTTHVRQLQIKENQVRVEFLSPKNAFAACGCQIQVMERVTLKDANKQLAVIWIVFDIQDPERC